MSKMSAPLFLLGLFTIWSNALEVTPANVEVSLSLRDDPDQTVELETDFADGTDWTASSDRPFVSVIRAAGTAPQRIGIRFNQLAVADFLSDKEQRTAATITIRGNGESVEVPVKLQQNDLVIREFYRTPDPNSLVFQSQWSSGPIQINKMRGLGFRRCSGGFCSKAGCHESATSV